MDNEITTRGWSMERANGRLGAIALSRFSPEFRKIWAQDPRAPQPVLRILATDKAEMVREEVASNPSAPPDLLAVLAGDGDESVRVSVAGNSSTPAYLLAAMASDPSPELRWHVAWNRSATEPVLAMLAGDTDESVRESVAGNPYSPPHVLDALSIDYSEGVRATVAMNRATPEDVINRLASDRDELVRSMAAFYRNGSADGTGGPTDPAPARWAHELASTALVSLARSQDRRNPRQQTAARTALVVLASRWLSGDWMPSTADAIALLDTPGDARVLGEGTLSDADAHPEVICHAARIGATPRTILTMEGADPQRLTKPRARAAVLATPDDWPPSVRVRVGAAAGGRELDSAVASPDRWVRLGLEANPRLMRSVEELSRASDTDARALAGARESEGHKAASRELEVSQAAATGPEARDHDWVHTQARERLAALTERTQIAVASHPQASGLLLRELAGKSSEAVRFAVGLNANTPAEVRRLLGVDAGDPRTAPGRLAELASSADAALRVSVAGNRSAPTTVLEALAQDPFVDVRKAVAGHPNSPAAVLGALAKNAVPDVRQAVAGNPATPGPVLAVLAEDWAGWVRSAVAGNPAVPASVLECLARDPDASVRRALVDNVATPTGVLERLAMEGDLGAARKVAAPAVLSRVVAVAQDRDTQPDDLRRLATHEALDVRAAVAGNRSTPGDVLQALASEERVSVRLALAGNASAPEQVLHLLASTPFGAGQVHSAIAGNPATPPEVLAVLVRPPVTKHAYRSGLSLTDNEPCFNLAGNPNTPAEVLSQLLDHPEGGKVVWPALAGNPAAPAAVVHKLAELGVVEVLDRPNLTDTNLLTLARRKGVTHERAVAELLVRYLNGELVVDAGLIEGLQLAGGDARRLAELLVSDPSLPLELVAAAAAAGVSTKALLNVPSSDGVLSESASLNRVRANPAEHPEHSRLRAAATSTGEALRAAAKSPDPVVRWGAAAAPKAGPLLAELVTDPDQRVSGLAARRVSEALG